MAEGEREAFGACGSLRRDYKNFVNKPISLLPLLLMLFACLGQPARSQSENPAILKRQVAALEKELESAKAEAAALKAENAALKRENAQMKRELEVQPKMRVLPGFEAEQRTQPSKGGYWLTISTGKRHNSSCRYFQGKNGRACGPREGEACKVCGG